MAFVQILSQTQVNKLLSTSHSPSDDDLMDSQEVQQHAPTRAQA